MKRKRKKRERRRKVKAVIRNIETVYAKLRRLFSVGTIVYVASAA